MITGIICGLINAYIFIIFIYVVLSYFPNKEVGLLGQIYGALGALCDWFLDIFRRIVPPIGGVLDISPILAWLVLVLLQLLVRIIL